MDEKTIKAITEVARAAARHFGWNEKDIVVTVCRPKQMSKRKAAKGGKKR